MENNNTSHDIFTSRSAEDLRKLDEAISFEEFMTAGYTRPGVDYGVPEMIPILISSIEDGAVRTEKAKKSNFILWADHYFHSLFPLKPHAAIWINQSEELHRILDFTESALTELKPDYSVDIFHKGTRELLVEYEKKKQNPLIAGSFLNMMQHMHLYGAVLAHYNNDPDELKTKIGVLLEDTKQNVFFLLSQKDADKLLESGEDGFNGFLIPGFDYWQDPLQWLSDEANEPTDSRLALYLVPAFEQYCAFLRQYQSFNTIECLKKLMIMVEARLLKLHRLADGEK